jgi:hypothetical protein
MPVEPLTQQQSWVSMNLSMGWVNEFGCRRVVVVDELSVDELLVNKLSFDELSVDGLSPHRWNG